MSFEQIPEILKNLVVENLQDPEQQRDLIKTVAGFVTRPDSGNVGFDYGRLQQMRIQDQQDAAAEAAAVKAQEEREKEKRDRLFKIGLKDVESAYRMDEIRERARLERERDKLKTPTDYKFMQGLFKGDVPLSLAVSQVKGRYVPRPEFMIEMASYPATRSFSIMSTNQLALNTEFQNFIKNIVEKNSKQKAENEKVNPLLGSKLIDFGIKSKVITRDEGTLVPELIKKGDSTQTNVAKNFPVYLKNSSKIFKYIFSSNFTDRETLSQFYDPSLSTDQMKKRFNKTKQLFNRVSAEVNKKGLEADSESLQELGKDLADIIDYMGESENFKSAVREALKPKVIYGDEKGVSVIPNEDGKIASITEIDARFITRNSGIRAISTYLGILNRDHIPSIGEDVQTTAKNKITGRETTVFGQSSKTQVANLINNIENKGKNNSVIEKARSDALKQLRENQFDRDTLKTTSMDLYNTFVKQGEDVNAFEIVTYLASQQIKRKGINYQPNGLTRHTVYKSVGKDRQSEKDKKWFEEYSTTTNSMTSLLEQVDNMLLLAELNPDTFGGGILETGGFRKRDKGVFGTFSDIKNRFNGFVGFLNEAKLNIFGQDRNDIGLVGDRAEVAQSNFKNLVNRGRLSGDSNILLDKLSDKAFALQKELDADFDRSTTKTNKEYLQYMRKTVLLLEKTALTYKLAGIVQGDSTGGRTISDADFRIIYNNLWGEGTAPEMVSAAALTHLRQLTDLSLKRRRAEVVLAQATGGIFSDSQYDDISRSIYREEMKKFYFKNPKIAELRDKGNFETKEDASNDAADSFIEFYDTVQTLGFEHNGQKITFPTFTKNQIKKFYEVSDKIKTYMSLSRDAKLTKQNRAAIKEDLDFFDDEDFRKFADVILLIDLNKETFSSSNVLKDTFRTGVVNPFGSLSKNMQDINTNYKEYSKLMDDVRLKLRNEKITQEEAVKKVDELKQKYFTSTLGPQG